MLMLNMVVRRIRRDSSLGSSGGDQLTNQPVENQAAYTTKHSNTAMRGRQSGGCISSSYSHTATDHCYSQQRSVSSSNNSNSCSCAVAMKQVVQRGTRYIISCSKVATGDRRNVFLNQATIKLRWRQEQASPSERCRVNVCRLIAVAAAWATAVAPYRVVAAYGNSHWSITGELNLIKSTTINRRRLEKYQQVAQQWQSMTPKLLQWRQRFWGAYGDGSHHVWYCWRLARTNGVYKEGNVVVDSNLLTTIRVCRAQPESSLR